MNNKRLLSFIAVVAVLALASISCSFFSSGSDEPVPEVVTEQVSNNVETTQSVVAPSVGQPVASLEDLEKAVIFIEFEGSYKDPYEGWQVNAGGFGSGFIIDPSGLAVTNNHVVSGASNLKVWVAGESTPRNAVVLGVSECNDLAVIDLEGDGYDYLNW